MVIIKIMGEYVVRNNIDSSHIVKCDDNKDSIFKSSFWCNEKGHRALTKEANRREAEAIMLFGQTYFPEHFPTNHPVVHTDVLAMFIDSYYNKKALALPRSHSKSTIVSFLLPMYQMCFHKRRFIVIVSDSEDKAKDFCIRIRDELEHNTKLIRDFTNGQGFKTTDWSKTDFTTSTGIRVVGKGSNQSLRGMIHKDTRPDLIILDDLETNETAGSENILRFVLTDVLPSVNRRGSYDICYIGTIIKDMAILHQMLINEGWVSAKWECMDENGEMIAPMLLSKKEYDSSKKMYSDLGKLSIFYAEMHNNPSVADSQQTFKQDYFLPFEESELDLTNMNTYIAYDPAMPDRVGKRGKADRSAIIVLATDSKENWYVVRCYANRDTPSKNRELLFNLAKKYKPNKVWMETIAAQRAMYLEIVSEMKNKSIKFPFEEIPSQTGSKEARIEQLQPLYESGRVYHNKKDKEMIELERELLLFGRTSHDDRSDCLSFFLNRVKYPRRIVQDIGRRKIDFYDKFFDKPSSSSWKVL